MLAGSAGRSCVVNSNARGLLCLQKVRIQAVMVNSTARGCCACRRCGWGLWWLLVRQRLCLQEGVGLFR